MTDTSTPSTERRSHPPLWLVEGLDIVEQRRSVLIAVTIGVIALGGILAVLAPGVVPPVPIVGAAVALAALLLGLAVAVALDATDLRLRGPRHVGAAGGELVAVLPTRAERAGAETLAGAVLEARVPGSPLLLGLAASGRDIRPTVAWTDALATALEAGGVSVLRIDLASGPTRSAGLLEVVRDGVNLASAVTFGPEPKVARLGAGADLAAALGALSALPGRLPRDLDVLLVALPMAASRPVVTAVRSLDHVLIVAQRDRTSRVELIAGLDALEAAGTRAQVALLDDRTAARLAQPSEDAPATGTDPDVVDDTTDDAGEPAGSRPSRETPRSEPSAPVPDVADPEPELEPESAPAAVDEVPDADATHADAPDEGVADEDAPDDDVTEDVEDVEAAVEQSPEVGSGTAAGPRSGVALGIGGAALTAAGIAAAFDVGGSGADAEPDEPDAASLDEPDAPRADEPDAPSAEASGGRAPNLGPDGGDDEAAVAGDGADSDPAASPVGDERPTPRLSERREVDVVDGAAEAAAIALVALPVELPFDTHGVAVVAEGARPVGGEVALQAESSPDLPPAPVDLDVSGGPVEPDEGDGSEPSASATAPSGRAGDAAVGAADLDRTGEVPAADPPDAISDADAEHDEMMRTTAQLSALVDDPDVGGVERPLDTP